MDKISLQTKDSTSLFLNWHFDPSNGMLSSKNKNVRLQPRHAKLLSLFLENADLTLSRNELIEFIWEDKTVNEDALSRCVAELRSILGDDRNNPKYIITIPKKGYRFICPLKVNQPKLLKYAYITIIIFILTLIYYFGFQPSPKLMHQYTKSLAAAKRVTTDKDIEHHPQLSNNGNSIAFSVREKGLLIVKVINLKGELEHKIINSNLDLFSASFSPDDQSLLIAGLNNQSCSIYIYHLPAIVNENQNYVKEHLGECMAPIISGIFDWSFKDNKFAFVAASKVNKDDSKNKASAIWTYDIDTKQKHQITFPNSLNIFDSRPQYSPDGKELAFTRGTVIPPKINRG